MTKETNSPESKTEPTNHKDFLTVGIGASAGGIRALKEFFSLMPSDSGMAFVVVLHLSPTHESSLADILQKETEMPVTQVTDSVKVEPNKVYVIPPNKNLAMMDGSIAATEFGHDKGSRVAVDLFFRTLANAHGKNAIGVVMSGTGNDGTSGIKRIKESNGFAIVQDPEDAEYDGMPRSAMATSLVDWVLPISEMPERLLKFKESSERLKLTHAEDSQTLPKLKGVEALPEVITLLRLRTGHDFSHYKHATLLRRIARHLQIYDLDDINDYVKLLHARPEDIQSLLKNLLINVTNFFRDEEAFDALEKDVIPKLFEGKTGTDSVRVWSVGCASGEEAYSLGILLSEFASTLTDPPKLQLFATDVDDDAISEARDHYYPISIEADVSPARLKQFFAKEGELYRVRKELRDLILFAPHNVLRDPPFSRLDLIVCRNLLIYLNRVAQDQVLQIFHFATRPDGFLFLGSSESAEGQSNLFAPVDKKHRIYSRRPSNVHLDTPVLPLKGEWQLKIPEIPRLRDGFERQISYGEIHYKLVEQYAPPSVLVNEDFEIVHLSESAGRYFRFTGGEPSSNLFKAINPDLLADVRAALYDVKQTKNTSEFPNIKVNINGESKNVNLIVRQVEVPEAGRAFLLVIFDEISDSILVDSPDREPRTQIEMDEARENVVRRLEEELQRTKDRLRVTIEQYETAIEESKASHEELQAINEELRSAAEELETGKEELQSVNEEIATVNNELKDKIDELASSNSDMKNLMSSTDIGTIFLDRQFRVKLFTPAVEKLFNLIPSDVGRPLDHISHKLDYDGLMYDAESVLRSLRRVEDEVRDTSGNVYLMSVVPYRATDDRVDGLVLTFVDITEREKAEENLRQADERFRAIVNQAAAGVAQIGFDGKFLLVNHQFCDLTGYEENELLGMDIQHITHPEDVKLNASLLANMVSSGKPFQIEERYIDRHGKAVWVHNSSAVLRDRKGNPQSAIAFVIDITQRKSQEENQANIDNKAGGASQT